jgi:hypothetical protein
VPKERQDYERKNRQKKDGQDINKKNQRMKEVHVDADKQNRVESRQEKARSGQSRQ